MVGIYAALFLPETPKKPLRGDPPRAANKREAKLLLKEAYSHIDERVDKIDDEILSVEQQSEELQQRRQALVDRHPKLN